MPGGACPAVLDIKPASVGKPGGVADGSDTRSCNRTGGIGQNDRFGVPSRICGYSVMANTEFSREWRVKAWNARLGGATHFRISKVF